MRIAIIDDEYAGRSELRFFISQYVPDAVFEEAKSGKEAIELFHQYKFDAAFVDMDLGDLKGNNLTKMLLDIQSEVKIVFATAYEAFAVQAFELGVVDYLMKPFDPLRVKQSIQKIESSIRRKGQESYVPQSKLVVPSDSSTLLLDTNDIIFIETENRHCIVHTVQGEYMSTQGLTYFEKKIDSPQFHKTHKSYFVNLDYVKELIPWVNGAYILKLKCGDKKEIPVSRGYMKQLKEVLGM